ncbi:helix-turn-helix transcriptional regulator [Luteimonas qiangzhengi]|uniref:helix-turn-helix transcriptional regulator n=1 Tax=Luteimonas sp. MJ146 TaxID=3129240 RepID=UPI0031BBC6AC
MNAPQGTARDNPPLVGRVRIAQIVPVVGLSRPTIYRMIAAGEFPAPQRISARASLYDAAEVCDWLRDPLAWAARNKAEPAAPTAAAEPAAATGWGQP